MKTLRIFAFLAVMLPVTAGMLTAQGVTCGDQGNWASFNFGNPQTDAIDTPLLLTDGRVMAQYVGTAGNQYQDWYALTPDNKGCYSTTQCAAGWSELASLYPILNHGYGPSGFAEAVLPDGNVIIQGGEENLGSGFHWTNMGAIFNPTQGSQGTWTALNPPGSPSWPYIGDAPSVVLANGNWMVGACNSAVSYEHNCPDSSGHLTYRDQAFLVNEANQTWQTITYPTNNKADANSEEGWTLLPSGDLLTVDTNYGSPHAEVFNPNANPPSWSEAGNLTTQLYGSYPGAGDIGPAILLTDGTVLATGTILVKPPDCNPSNPMYPCVSGNTAIYDPNAHSWTAGPSFQNLSNGYPTGMGDSSATLLPDGNVLLPTPDSQGVHHYQEYQYQTKRFCAITNAPSNLVNNPHTGITMLLLPSGQVFVTTGRTDYYIYTPSTSYGPQQGWRPTVNPLNGVITPGQSYIISGTQFNGLSQGTNFGDESQSATNYPLVQITDSTGLVYYARTYGHSTMGVATGGTPTSTHFTVPCNVADGMGSLLVIANGISSSPATSIDVGGQCPVGK